MVLRLLLAMLLFPLAAAAAAQSDPVEMRDLRICTDGRATTPRAIDPASCRVVRLADIDPQGRLLWVLGTFDLPDARDTAPLGLYLSGKMASSVWWNGHRLGANGQPGPTASAERAGRMDAVLFVPPSLTQAGPNRVAIRMSGMQGILHLDRPIHWIGVAAYAQPVQLALADYWPALITFGAFVAAALYFGAMAARRRDTAGSALLTAMSAFAAGQLLAEVSRGLTAYTYPLHDARLLAILVCASGFGLALFAYLWRRFATRSVRKPVAVVALLTLLVASATPGFDGKTTMAVLLPVTCGIAGLAWWAWRRRPGAVTHLGALAVFAFLILWAPFAFLDRNFYLAVAALLGFLFIRQALALVAEERQRIEESTRAKRLEAALDAVRQRNEPVRVPVSVSGRTDFVPTESIVLCRGAGDYVELVLTSGATLLHGGTLSELERMLSATFLRVHRSYIVNTAFVSALTREPAGTGSLSLSNGDTVPVSRRIMPSVKGALAR